MGGQPLKHGSIPQAALPRRIGKLLYCGREQRTHSKVNSQGIITTIAGTGVFLFSGRWRAATNANLSPSSVALDNQGNRYLSDGNTASAKWTQRYHTQWPVTAV